MKNILKPASRLIVVFILTMIISGGILAYLGIKSISNLRELTEKKVSEEQSVLAGRIVSLFQEFLEGVTRQCTEEATVEEELNHEVWMHLDTSQLVELPFIMDRAGDFRWPRKVEDYVMMKEVSFRPSFQQNINVAQKSEFQNRDFGTAVQYYSRSLEFAEGKADSAFSYNAMARVGFKIRDPQLSYGCYSRIASEFTSVLDNSGFPYIYYALMNLMELKNLDPQMDITGEVRLFLEGILAGSVPVNSSTRELLEKIRTYKKQSGMVRYSQSDEWELLIQRIERYLLIIESDNALIQACLQKWKSHEDPLMLGECIVVNHPASGPGTILVICPAENDYHGFCMNLDSLWDAFMKTKFPQETEFEYSVTAARRQTNDQEGNQELIYTGEFSTYFPGYVMSIQLQDADLIDTFVKRRSWSYGIAFILLLGAMSMGVLLILRDILREKKLGRMRSDFVSNVTHELKTPLTSISLYAESVLLERVPDETGRKEYLKIVLRETERLKRMINNILDFSKKEKGILEYRMERVNITALIVAALEELGYWFEESGFHVIKDLEENLFTEGDPDALKQVIINLLDNAIKYSGQQKEINVRIFRQDGRIRLEVEDRGIGIPDNLRETIFEKFYRVNDPRVEGTGGTGLGLTMVKEIIEAHHGEVSVRSTVNRGSTFTIFLNSA